VARIFYRDENEVLMEILDDGMNRHFRKAEDENIDSLVASGEAILYDSEGAAKAGIDYKLERTKNYPSIRDQLDQIYHEGIDAWKETIQAVKDAHPKPE